MRIAVAGSTGLIGSALVDRLTQAGHEVVRLIRPGTSTTGTAPGPEAMRWDPDAGTIDAAGLEGVDAVVNLGGRSIGAKRWSTAEKQRLWDSRIGPTRLLATTIAELDRPPAAFLSASAVGYYGSRGDETLTEESGRGRGFLADLVVDWEAATAPAAEAGVRTVLLRTGLVVSGKGGLLGTLLPIFKLGVGGRLGDGSMWWPWVSLTDEVRAIEHLLAADASGPVNLVGPQPVTNAEFTRTLGRVLRRPAVLPVPRFGPKLLFGGEVTEEVVFTSQRVLPRRLEQSGFRHHHTDLEPALREELGR